MRRRGVTGFVVQMTITSVGASVVLVAVMTGLLWGPDEPMFLPGVVMAAMVPAVVAPPVLVFSVRLAAGLDRASHLLWEAAHTDPLTGLANRRAFFDELDRTDGVAPVPTDVAVVDLDAFKKINDLHGHSAGDVALQEVASWLIDLAGADGMVARMGGDEFAVLIPSPEPVDRPTRQQFVSDGLRWSITLGWHRCETGDLIEAGLRDADVELYAHKPVRDATGRAVDRSDEPQVLLDDAHVD
jgi:diguanylate cyclase (GGDEF)-like protein